MHFSKRWEDVDLDEFLNEERGGSFDIRTPWKLKKELIMSYWGNEVDGSDYAFTTIGSYIVLIKKRMFKDLEGTLEESFEEQSLIASLACIRLIGERFPECLSVSFRRSEFERAKAGYYKWYELVESKLPFKRKVELKKEAEKEMALLEALMYGEKVK